MYQQAKSAYERGQATRQRIEDSKEIVLDYAISQSEEMGEFLKQQLRLQRGWADKLRLTKSPRDKQIGKITEHLEQLDAHREGLEKLDPLRDALYGINETMHSFGHTVALMESTLVVGQNQLDTESMVQARG